MRTPGEWKIRHLILGDETSDFFVEAPAIKQGVAYGTEIMAEDHDDDEHHAYPTSYRLSDAKTISVAGTAANKIEKINPGLDADKLFAALPELINRVMNTKDDPRDIIPEFMMKGLRDG